MELRVLGAHNMESPTTRLVSLVVDGRLALDAGSLTSGLSFDEQAQLQAILLTHQHFDHFRDILTFGLAQAYSRSIPLYALAETLKALRGLLQGGRFYPDFFRWPPEKPVFLPREMAPGEAVEIDGYRVVPHRVSHPVPSVGYEVLSPQGRSLFYTGDIGSGSSCWEVINPHLIVTEVTGPDQWQERIAQGGHLTPSLLRGELWRFRRARGYLPPVLLVHLTPMWRRDIEAQVEGLSRELGTPITLAREGMRVQV